MLLGKQAQDNAAAWAAYYAQFYKMLVKFQMWKNVFILWNNKCTHICSF
jgi:glucan phosphoethanolaminetransferase (alkaline phosphatase superfamily)